jgi:hypothetical protein
VRRPVSGARRPTPNSRHGLPRIPRTTAATHRSRFNRSSSARILRADVDRVLESLRAAPDTRFAALGRRSMLPAQVGLSPSLAVDRVFGRGFSGLLREVPLGVWSGPVNSGYGVHLVRITEAVPGRLPALAEVRDAVARDWSAARGAEARQAIFDRLRSRYAVKIAETPSPDVARQ